MSASGGWDRKANIALSARMGAMAELTGVFLKGLEVSIDDAPPEPPYDVEMTIKPAASALDHGLINYEIVYDVNVVKGDVSALSLNCTYLASYAILEDAAVSREEIEAFGSTIVLFALHPYVRELVHNISSRTLLAPLTLGTMQLPLEVSEILTGSIGS